MGIGSALYLVSASTPPKLFVVSVAGLLPSRFATPLFIPNRTWSDHPWSRYVFDSWCRRVESGDLDFFLISNSGASKSRCESIKAQLRRGENDIVPQYLPLGRRRSLQNLLLHPHSHSHRLHSLSISSTSKCVLETVLRALLATSTASS